jgi:hypothetical protein
MITPARITALRTLPGAGWITALRAPQLKTLVEAGAIQLSLFDEANLAQISQPRRTDRIEAEAATCGIYVVRTSLPGSATPPARSSASTSPSPRWRPTSAPGRRSTSSYARSTTGPRTGYGPTSPYACSPATPSGIYAAHSRRSPSPTPSDPARPSPTRPDPTRPDPVAPGVTVALRDGEGRH